MSGTVGADHARHPVGARILGADPSSVRGSGAHHIAELYERELGLMAREAGVVEGSGSPVASVAWAPGGPAAVGPRPGARPRATPGRDLEEIADSLWYPLWDSGIGLDHSVRTVDQCLSVAASDVCAGLSLLDARWWPDGDLEGLVVDGARRCGTRSPRGSTR